jgi:hypothetical protein
MLKTAAFCEERERLHVLRLPGLRSAFLYFVDVFGKFIAGTAVCAGSARLEDRIWFEVFAGQEKDPFRI